MHSHGSVPEKKISKRLVYGCVAVLLVLSLAAQWQAAGTGDKGLWLAYGQMWLKGARPYHDMFQPNLPAIVWFYALSAKIADISGVQPSNVAVTLTSLLVAFSAFLCGRILCRHSHAALASAGRKHGVIVALILLFFVDSRFFADREHMMMVLLFPYLILSLPSLDNSGIPVLLRAQASIMAGMALCFKPHALVLVGGITALRIIRKPQWRTIFSMEHMAIGVVVSGYLLLIGLLSPEFFSVVFPMTSATYSAMAKGIETLQYYIGPLFLLAVILADFRLRHNSPLRRDILYYLAVIALCLVYVVSNNGWVYTFYPLNSVILLLAFWLLQEFRWLKDNGSQCHEEIRQFHFGSNACKVAIAFSVLLALLTTMGAILYASQKTDTPRDRLYREMTQVITDQRATGFGTITSTASFWTNAVQETGVMMSTRFIQLYMLPRFLMEGESFTRAHEWIIRYVADAYADDLKKKKPEVVFVDDGDDFFGIGQKVDLVAYFSRYASFRESWKRYRLLRVIDHCGDAQIQQMRYYRVWCRHKVYVLDQPSPHTGEAVQ